MGWFPDLPARWVAGYRRVVRLPVFEIEEELKRAVSKGQKDRVLLKAPTGSGKSTALPGMLLEAGLQGRVVVIEPRRMAARLLAGWVASQRGAALGGEVGYAVRFDRRYGADTRLIYVTDGVFQRWLQEDPELSGVGAVVFDEFHERRLAVDVALGRCLDLQDAGRPDLRVVVMSATLETAGLAEYLGREAVVLEAGGRTYPIEVFYRPERIAVDRRGGPPQETPVWERVVAVCREAMAQAEGHVLCFLPGMHEIRKTVELLKTGSVARGWEICPLHSSLPPAAQEQAVRSGGGPRVIVATNVAETSLTIEGVRVVIDAGTARVASFDPRRGIDTLLVKKISRASAEQRAGRAGRTGPGRCYRLWSEAEHWRREAFDAPEVRRVDLAEVVLLLKAAGVREVRDFRWLDAPMEDSLRRAEQLLDDLGALADDGSLSEVGCLMAGLPLAPRAARLLLAGVEHGCVAEAAFVAAAMEGDGIFAAKRGMIGRKDFTDPADASDFEAEWRAFESAVAMQFDGKRCGQAGIHGRGSKEVGQALDRLRRMAVERGWAWGSVDFRSRREGFGKAMLAAYSDRLGVRLGAATLASRVVGRRKGKLDDESAVRSAAAFVAAEMTEVEGREVVVHLRRAAAVELEWLEELFPGDYVSRTGAAWDESRRRVVARKEKVFRDLVLEAKDNDMGVPLDAAAELLAERVIAGELILKKWDAAVEQWCARLDFLHRTMPELGLPGWGEEDRVAAVAQICHGAIAYKDIKDIEVWPVLNDWLSPAQKDLLDRQAPERLSLSNGMQAKVHYEMGKDPWVAMKVAHLMGVWQTPTVAGGRIPLLVHILAPNQRPWQMTKDLAGFWANGYFQMKKELGGRYPRHPWPDDPKAEWVKGKG